MNLKNSLVLILLLASAVVNAAVTVTKEPRSGNTYVNTGDGSVMLARPVVGVARDGTMAPMQIDSTGVGITASWVAGTASREIDVVETTSTVETFTYKHPDASIYQVIVVTYSNSAHDAIVTVKRTQ